MTLPPRWRLDLLSGLIFWLATIPWVAPTMLHNGDVPWPLAGAVLLALSGYLALYPAAFCWLLGGTPLRSSAAYVAVAASGTILFTPGFWVAVIVGIVPRIRPPVRQSKQSRSNAALDVLRQPYAHGEIKSEEFEARTGDSRDG